MKIIGYYFAKWVMNRHGDKSDYHQEVALWSLICLKNLYIAIFIIIPVIHLFNIDGLEYWSSKEKSLLYGIPLFLIDYFYFFWNGRWEKIYEEVKQWNSKRRKFHRNNLILVISITAIISTIYQYYNFSFGRW